jgi:two-component system LytT family response regulator
MDRVRARLRMQRESAVGCDVAALMAAAGAPIPDANTNRLRVRDGRRTIFLEPREVDWIAADGDYVRIHAGRTSFLCRDTIARLERTLASCAFVRIHRSAIVNLARVRQVSTHEKDLRVLMRDGTRLRASRTHAERLRVALGM